MRAKCKQRIKELEASLEYLTFVIKSDSSSVHRSRYRFCLDTYMLNINLLSFFESYSPRYK